MKKLYKNLVQSKVQMSFYQFKELLMRIYDVLIEIDKFKKDFYHQIFYYSYLVKNKKNQSFIAIEVGMDQSTISRKQKEIKDYIIVKLKEFKNNF